MKNYKISIIISIALAVMLYFAIVYINFLKEEHRNITYENYKNQALNLKNQISNLILLKQKSTLAIALSLTNDKNLGRIIKQKKIPPNCYDNLIKKFKKNTLYKNIWIQILDSNLTSLYRSWSKLRGDNLSKIRDDLVMVKENKKPDYSISIDRFDLSIKAMTPVFWKNNFIGIIEIISHFNSIAKQLEKSKIFSLVLLDKSLKKQLFHPINNSYIDDYYIVNLHVKKELIKYIEKRDIKRYLKDSYLIENGYLIVTYLLKNKEGKTIGYYLTFQNLSDIPSANLNFFILKWFAYTTIAILSFILLVSFFLYLVNKKQKDYYRNIMDSSTNIVIINDMNRKKIISANKIFFKYFYKFKNLQEFHEKCIKICDLFEEEDGCLQKNMEEKFWIEYLLENSNKTNKVKITYEKEVYYFSVSASLIDATNNHYSIIFTDITKEELYKKELEELSVTDHLTKAKNRRYFQHKLQEEISKANRYNSSLSLIMIDIDHFKKINDSYGHDIGDKILIEYSKLINSNLRINDIFCRVGGEEFIIILPFTDEESGYKIAEKLRKIVETHPYKPHITISLGVAKYKYNEDSEEFLKRLDEALYKAKRCGRNRVEIG